MDSDDFLEVLKKDCGINPEKPVIAGVSGGPDSLCMLDLLIKSGVPVLAVHFNHQLRLEADDEARQVSDFCDSNRVKCVIGAESVGCIAQEQGLSVEECARSLRYKFLFQQAEIWKAQAVMVAHNAEDQIETILMHLLRGSGLSGLRGMQMRSYQPQWNNEIPLVRPLLKTSRSEIMAYCLDHNLSPAMDQTNEDVKYFRNRIRHELVPFLETYNSQVKTHLASMADLIYQDDDLLNRLTEKAFIDCVVDNGARFIRFSFEPFKVLHPSLQRRLLRETIQRIEPQLRDIDFGVIDRAMSFLNSQLQTNHLDLMSDVEIIKDSQKRIIICDKRAALIELWPQIDRENHLQLDLSGNTSLSDGWQIEVNRVDTQPPFTRDGMTCVLDASTIPYLRLDTVKPGDRFSPFSLKGKTIKLTDFWTKVGLPERARAHWPLLRNEKGEIVWVPGYQISDAYKVTSETREFLVLKLFRNKEDYFSPAN